MSHGANESCITQHVVAQGGYASEVVRNPQNTVWRCRKKLCFFLNQPLHASCGRPGPGGHIYRTFAWMFWMSCLAEVILFLESGHTERQTERERGGGGWGRVRDWTELTASVNFAFSSMPSDMHEEERQARLERELKCMSRQRRVSKRTVAYRPAVSIRLSRSLGFPTCLFLVSLLSGPHERRPMASRKEQLSSSFFLSLNHTDSSRKPFNGVQKGQVHSKKHKPSKKYFCGRSTQGSPPAGLKGKLRSKIISSDMIFFRWIRWRKTGTCEHLWRHGATLVPPRNHGKVTRLNQDIRDQPESSRVKWWHDAHTLMTAIVILLVIVTQFSHDALNLDPMAQEILIFVTFWYLYFSCGLLVGKSRSWTAPMVCSRQSIGWGGLWRSCYPSCQIFGPYDSNQSAASLTLHENDAVHVQLTSGTSSSNREEERPPEPITGFGSRAGTTNCDASGLGGFVRRYLSTTNLRITSNFFRWTMYLVSHSVLCHWRLVKQHSQNDKKKKKKRCQCTTKLTQVSSFSESHTSHHGRVRHQIRDWSESGRSRELLTPGTSDWCRPCGVVTRDFSASFDRLFDRLPVRISTSDLHHWILRKKSFILELMILECSFPLIVGGAPRAYSLAGQ